MAGDTHRRYPPELRERAVRLVAEVQGEYESEWAAMTRVSELLGVGTAETVRKWVRRAEVDQGARPGTTSEGGRQASPVLTLHRPEASARTGRARRRSGASARTVSRSSAPGRNGRILGCAA